MSADGAGDDRIPGENSRAGEHHRADCGHSDWILTRRRGSWHRDSRWRWPRRQRSGAWPAWSSPVESRRTP